MFGAHDLYQWMAVRMIQWMTDWLAAPTRTLIEEVGDYGQI